MNIKTLPTDLSTGYCKHNFVFSDGERLKQHIAPDMPFIFDGMALGICLKGTASVSINYQEYVLTEKSLITVMPKQLFQTLQYSEDFSIEILFLSSSFVEELPLPRDFDILKHIYDMPCLQANGSSVSDLLELHSLISKYSQLDIYYQRQAIRALFYTLILRIASEYRREKQSIFKEKRENRKDFLTQRFFMLLSAYYINQRDVAFYADKLCVTAKYLTTVIKQITGRTASDWINMSVIVEIKQRLSADECSISQLAEEMNFPDSSTFSRYFRRHTGISPLAYRSRKD